MKEKTIAVTGSSGFIGSHLVEEILKEKPKKIYYLDLKTGYDLCCYDETEKFFKKNKIDIVFDLATLPLPLSLVEPRFVVCDIIRIATNLCELNRKGFYKTLIHTSSSESYGSAQFVPMSENHPLAPTTPYASAKASADLIILSYHKTFGIDTAIARCFNTYGERQPIRLGAIIPKTIYSVLQNKPIEIYGNGKQTRDFIYVKDAVRGIIEVYKNKRTRGKIINIGSGQEVLINKIVKQICDILAYEGKILHTKDRISDVKRHFSDISLAQKILKFKPEFSLQEGLERTITWYVNDLMLSESL